MQISAVAPGEELGLRGKSAWVHIFASCTTNCATWTQYRSLQPQYWSLQPQLSSSVSWDNSLSWVLLELWGRCNRVIAPKVLVTGFLSYVCRGWGESSQVKILVPVNTLCFFPFFLSLCNRGKPRKEEVCFFVLFVRKRLLNLLLRMFELNPLAWGGYFFLIWLFFEQAVKKQNETEGSVLSSWKEASGL